MIRRAFDSILRRSSADGDIFIFTMPRSGMTWLLEMFNTLDYSRCVQEPMTSAWIPEMSGYFKPGRHYIFPDSQELTGITNYLRDIQNNRIFRMGYNFRRGRKLRTNLNVIALARVSNLAPYLESTLGVRPLAFVRHPIANSLSRYRNSWHLIPRFGEKGWHQFIDVYLESDEFCRNHLPGNLAEFCWRVRKEGEDLERYVLSWSLDNIVLLNEVRSKPWLLVCYEDLVLKPEWVIQQITDHFKLRGTDAMTSRVGIPSRSSHLSLKDTVDAIRDPAMADQIVSRWRQQVDATLVSKCFNILEAFEITLYTTDSDNPNESWNQFRTAGNVSNMH